LVILLKSYKSIIADAVELLHNSGGNRFAVVALYVLKSAGRDNPPAVAGSETFTRVNWVATSLGVFY
jgi:hypothetical protein